jgi:hypothetical protein
MRCAPFDAFGAAFLTILYSGFVSPTFAGARVAYELEARISHDTLDLTHTIKNSTNRSVCFYPFNTGMSFARFFGTTAEISNEYDEGAALIPTQIFIVWPDGHPHSFDTTVDFKHIFADPRDGNNIRWIRFKLYAYDCKSLVTHAYGQSPAVFVREIEVTAKRQ